jgi:hypothetical protein
MSLKVPLTTNDYTTGATLELDQPECIYYLNINLKRLSLTRMELQTFMTDLTIVIFLYNKSFSIFMNT